MIKKSARVFLEKGVDFNEDFETNKKILKDTMPSKKIRNQMAGYLVKLKKLEKEKEKRLSQNLKK